MSGSFLLKPAGERGLSAHAAEKAGAVAGMAGSSHLIHLSKPEEAFFRHIASQEGFDYEDVSFIDDRRANTDSASRLGIETLLYAGPDKDAKAAAFFARYLS